MRTDNFSNETYCDTIRMIIVEIAENMSNNPYCTSSGEKKQKQILEKFPNVRLKKRFLGISFAIQ